MIDMRAVFPIDRDALQDEVFAYLAEMGIDEWDVVLPIRRMIHNAPTLDYAPVRRGEWLDAGLYIGAKQYICSQCKDDDYWKKRYHNHKEPYCPNCGAKMREDGKNETT